MVRLGRLAPGARKFALPPLALAIPAAILAPGVGLALIALGAAVMAFFRDPERTPPPEGIVAPADGRVSVVREEGEQVRVGVFMNVTNVHVARAPIGGAVEYVNHRPGAHRPAFSKDSERNERVTISFGDHEVSLIAGAFARRIHPYVNAGDAVERGERLGHIAFGSRVDVVLPREVDRGDVAVTVGDRVRAGESVLVESGGIEVLA
jgi:phosphatidylserine decarboxylase